MPNFTNTVRLNKLPVTGLVPEKSGTAPAAPAVGQIWVDTSTTPNLVRAWDGTVWTQLQRYAGTGAENFAAGNDARITGALQSANNLSDLASATNARTNLGLGNSATLNTGTTAGTVAAGNDSRITGAEQTANKNTAGGYAGLDAGSKVAFTQLPTAADGATTASTVVIATDARLSNQRVPTDGSVTGGTAGAGVKIAAGTITDANVASANKDGAAGTASMRTLGTGANQAAAGNDARLSDTRTPTAGTVTNASVSGTAAIDESKLNLASDAAAGTASRRTIGTGALQAMAGNTTLSSIAAPTADRGMAGFKITNLGAPTAGTDAARLVDVQNAAAGIDVKPSVRGATTGNIALTGTQTIDGVALVAGDRVLVKNQTTTTENGLYVVAAGAWSRTTDTLTANSFVFVEEGTQQADTSWMITNNGTITTGTTAITWTQFAGAGTMVGTTNRITITGNTIDIAATYVGQTSITTLGTITSGTWNAGVIGLAYGGLGTDATSAAGKTTARANIGASRLGFAGDLGAVTAGTAVTITHNLGTQDVVTQIRDASTNELVYGDIINASANTVTFTSGIAYAAGALRAVVVPST